MNRRQTVLENQLTISARRNNNKMTQYCLIMGGAIIVGALLIAFGGWFTTKIYAMLGQK